MFYIILYLLQMDWKMWFTILVLCTQTLSRYAHGKIIK